MSFVLKLVGGVLLVFYPFLVYYGLSQGFPLLYIAALLLLVASFSYLRERRFLPLLFAFLLVFMTLFFKSSVPLKFYPVVMNALFCSMFAVSLRGESLVERFIKLRGEELSENKKSYARKVTVAWAIFLGINTLVSLATVFASDEVWTFYNGLLSYVLIGLMFVIEYLVRCRLKSSL